MMSPCAPRAVRRAVSFGLMISFWISIRAPWQAAHSDKLHEMKLFKLVTPVRLIEASVGVWVVLSFALLFSTVIGYEEGHNVLRAFSIVRVQTHLSCCRRLLSHSVRCGVAQLVLILLVFFLLMGMFHGKASPSSSLRRRCGLK